MNIQNFLGKKTIIAGDVGAGKTLYTLKILEAFVAGGYVSIAVIDLAPDMIRGIGGKMEKVQGTDIRYLTADIAAPRLMGGSEEEILELAKNNADQIERIFDVYVEAPQKILFINDVTLYLHAGTVERLVTVIDSAETLVMNAYMGKTFQDSSLSRRERTLLKTIINICDNIVRLPASHAETAKERRSLSTG